MTEHEIQQQILLQVGSRDDCVIWRNNAGAAKSRSGRFVRFGGLPGAADILGIIRGGRFLAIEVKSEAGRLTTQQQSFRKIVERMGGLYVLARNAHDAVSAVDGAFR